VEPLTTREEEILHFVAEGYSNQQVADKLIISIGTVKRHMSNILGKLSVKNRSHAVARAREIGLIE
ncbi:MAG: LuxR C-terminal-related transcriptional regulator, partial [Chloroflexota bacterium]